MNRLEAIFHEYKLNYNGISFWPPFWQHALSYKDIGLASDIPGPYKGKGTARQINYAAHRLLSGHTTKLIDGEQIRKLLKYAGIGIDCSGLAYNCLAQYLRQEKKQNLADYLFLPKSDIETAWQKYRSRQSTKLPSSQVVADLPAVVSVSEFCRLFHKVAAHHVNIERLTSTSAAEKLATIDSPQLGDMIRMSKHGLVHMGVIVKITTNTIDFFSSDDPVDGYGGPTLHRIKRLTSGLDLLQQEWSMKRFYAPKQGDGVFRLRILANG